MKPAPFTYMRPDSLDEAVETLAEHGADARLLAGGQSLMAMLNFRLVAPGVLVDISRMPEMGGIGLENGKIEVGASVTQNALLDWPELEAQAPFLARALPWVGHFQTRNRGTVCGSLAHADPSSELPLALALLEGEVVLRSASGTRVLKADDFQTGMLQTARAEDEIITAARFPAGVGARGAAFREVARRHGDFAIVAVGVVVKADGTLRLGVGGVADRPHCIEMAAGTGPDEARDRIEHLVWELGGFDDIHASARFRRDLVRRLAPTLIEEVRTCAA